MVRLDLEQSKGNMYQLHPFVWDCWAPSKVKIFVWRAIDGRIPTKSALAYRGITFSDLLCPFCSIEDEDVDHLLASYPFSVAIWEEVCRWVKIPSSSNFVDVKSILFFGNGWSSNKVKKKLLITVFFATMWSLWCNRNKKIFEGKAILIHKVLDDIKELAFLWLSIRSKISIREWSLWFGFNLDGMMY
ncbi:uncharacterized protein LOC143531975 [Bidens hawaiensis]|uniref:uncharacterized protein LOC143531975 n=1 Tax=Bidens hawaiensis TaxID=980011 RepID=UPI00404AFC88